MMEIRRKTPGRARSKPVARREFNSAPPPFTRWNNADHTYEFCVEFIDRATGISFEVAGNQLDWDAVCTAITNLMAEAPA